MRIRKVKWKGHPILGNLELDFVNHTTNRPYSTVVFAGENGAGKTTVMESLFKFLNAEAFDFDFFEYEPSVGQIFRALPYPEYPRNCFYRRLDTGSGKITEIFADKSNNTDRIGSDNLDPRHDGCAFSKAQSIFKSKEIKNTSTLQIDKEEPISADEDDYTYLKQLLVDVYNQDSNEYTEQNKLLGSMPISWDDYYPHSKMYRFTNAFNNFFEKISFSKIQSQGEKGYQILFKKHSNEISIDSLSTGEKQIVFRGASLLKNCKKISDGVIFVDEPEISMHPRWQKKVLQYYQDVFSDDEEQTAQCFFATHSEYVISQALKDRNNTLVIVLSDNGTITAHNVTTPGALPTVTAAETNYLAFNVPSIDYHIELYGYLQAKTGRHQIKQCDNYIKSQAQYDPATHSKPSSNGSTVYETLSTYIRNSIDHPDNGNTFTEEELITSIELLIELCK